MECSQFFMCLIYDIRHNVLTLSSHNSRTSKGQMVLTLKGRQSPGRQRVDNEREIWTHWIVTLGYVMLRDVHSSWVTVFLDQVKCLDLVSIVFCYFGTLWTRTYLGNLGHSCSRQKE